MPGRLMMDAQHSPAAQKPPTDLGHARDLMQKEGLDKGAEESSRTMTNGQHVPGLENGNTTNGVHTDAMDTENRQTASDADLSARLPPELEHFVDSYVPFGKLLERMSQQAYFDLGEMVDGMVDMSVGAPAVNGTTSTPQSTSDPSPVSIDKKRRLMEYAETQKNRFIKALVLSDWGKNMDEMNRLIELTMWLRRQDELHIAAADGLLNLQRNMVPAKMPNPNIEGALELLSTGKAPWMPDMDYIPLKPLTSEKLLKTLKDMNFMLSVRLNLHETLPCTFNQYTIANGRATFSVPGEFEVDLAAVDEDPQTPFYFIDIRLLFTPVSSFSNDRLRNELEHRVNEALATKGLQGCYDFLHGFILTHKLNVLKYQAIDLARSKWSGCIDVQAVHRSVVLQYWTGQPGGRNWIELGVTSGKNVSHKGDSLTQNPQISWRWFRRGYEILDHDLDLQFRDLSAEHILDEIIARHTNGRLNALLEQLNVLAKGSTAFSRSLHTSDKDPGQCYLQLQLDPVAKATTVTIQPVTGRIAISPPSSVSQDVEERLSNDPNIDPGQILRYHQCKLIQERIHNQAQTLGWLRVRTEKQGDLKTVFGREPVRYSVFKRDHWGQAWAFAVSIDLHGPKWWIVQLGTKGEAQTISNAEPISPSESARIPIDRDTLLDLENNIVAKISVSSVAAELRDESIRYRMMQTSAEIAGKDDLKENRRNSLYIDASLLLSKPPFTMLDSPTRLWCSALLKLSHCGFQQDQEGGKVVHVLRAALTKASAKEVLPRLHQSQSGDHDTKLQPETVFDMSIKTYLGAPVLPTIRQKLQCIERLCAYVHTACRFRFKIKRASPDGIAFCYASEPRLYAEITFPDAGDTTSATVQLRLYSEGDATNPHFQIHDSLRRILNPVSASTEADVTQSARAFDSFCQHLLFTLPLLHALLKIQTLDPCLRTNFQHRSAMHYKLIYSHPLPSHSFIIRHRSKNGASFWEVVDAPSSTPSDELRKKLRQEVWSSKGADWTGLTSGAFAGVNGIGELLQNIDDVVRGSKQDAAAAPTGEAASIPEGKTGSGTDKNGNKGREIVVLD